MGGWKAWVANTVIGAAVGLVALALQAPVAVAVLGAIIVAGGLSLGIEPLWRQNRERLSGFLARQLARIPFEVRMKPKKPNAPEGDRGVWDYERDSLRAQKKMNYYMNRMTKQTTRQGKVSERSGKQVDRVKKYHPGDIDRMYSVTSKYAAKIDRKSERMEELRTLHREQQDLLIENRTKWFAEQPAASDQSDWERILGELDESCTFARSGQNSFRRAVLELRGQNLSQPLNRATDRLAAVLGLIDADLAVFGKFCRDQGAMLKRRRSSRPGAK